MKKIVIYRDKKTNDIVSFHDYNEKCTLDNDRLKREVLKERIHY